MHNEEETDLYHFRCDGSRGRDRRWFTAKGGRRRSRTDAGRRRRMTLDGLPSYFGVPFLLNGAAVLWTLQQQFRDSLSRSEILELHASSNSFRCNINRGVLSELTLLISPKYIPQH